MSDDRPDPLAPLPPREPRRHPGQPEPPDLSRCATIIRRRPGEPDVHCQVPPSVILWMGCERGEHAGPMSYCAACVTTVARLRSLTCGQCGGSVRVLKLTSMDGHSTVALPEPAAPPPGLWQRAVPDAPQA